MMIGYNYNTFQGGKQQKITAFHGDGNFLDSVEQKKIPIISISIYQTVDMEKKMIIILIWR